MKFHSNSQRKRGRPRSFDREAALYEAMLLFWEHGYEGTSLSQLTAAMGIAPPSLYAAFGDKKQLFLEAVQCYTAGRVTAAEILDAHPAARDAVWKLLEYSAGAFTEPDTPAGCLLLSSASSCTPAARDVQAAVTELRYDLEARLCAKIQGAVDSGLLPRDADAGALALLYSAVLQGMSAQAREGTERARLLVLARAAMNAWPESAAE